MKRLIKINCEKICPKDKGLFDNYENFLDNIDKEFHIELSKELSVSNTPILLIYQKSSFLATLLRKKVSSLTYLWISNNNFYFKTPQRTFIAENLPQALDYIDEYFYK